MTQPGLRERAAAATPSRTNQNANGTGGSEPTIDFEIGEEPEAVHVKVAWSRVMRFCRALSKGSVAIVRDKTGKELYRYKYRGIDDVVSLAGTACRLYGVTIMPVEIKREHRNVGPASWTVVEVKFSITSLGDGEMWGVSVGCSLDYGDKDLVKAISQALRVYLTNALLLPTHDPSMDSDATPVMRPTPPTPFDLRDEILKPTIERQRLLAIRGELQRDPKLAHTLVPVPDGQGGEREESLWDLTDRRGKELKAASSTKDTQE